METKAELRVGPETERLMAGDGMEVDWEELKKLVLKQIPSWSLSVLSVPL